MLAGEIGPNKMRLNSHELPLGENREAIWALDTRLANELEAIWLGMANFMALADMPTHGPLVSACGGAQGIGAVFGIVGDLGSPVPAVASAEDVYIRRCPNAYAT